MKKLINQELNYSCLFHQCKSRSDSNEHENLSSTLVDDYFIMLNDVISYIMAAQNTYPYFPGFFISSVFHTEFFTSHCLLCMLSHITLVRTTVSSVRRINPLAINTISLSEIGIKQATTCPQVPYATDSSTWAQLIHIYCVLS